MPRRDKKGRFVKGSRPAKRSGRRTGKRKGTRKKKFLGLI